MATVEARNGHKPFTNYVSYQDAETGRERVGHYDLEKKIIQPLAFVSGTPIDNLYQVIQAGEANIISDGTSESLSVSSTKILPPFTGRDILCVGKNYAAHAKEFNSSGFDSSDKVDTPSHPVIFTKRFTSIIADGEEIYPHPGFTDTVDYEGEIGVVIGKPGFRISESDAMDHVWGYTIINDMTARERQRDHKQFYIGKSPDTFCPMGPIAVPAQALNKVLQVQTHVNGELRQDATTEDLIFSIPFLIKTMSEGQTLMPGDVLATGTPAGVGIGRKPPIYLKSGDTVTVSVTGLGSLTNRIGDTKSTNPTLEQLSTHSCLPQTNISRSIDSSILTQINNKSLYYKAHGLSSGSPIVFVHGLGGSAEFFTPLIQFLGLEKSHALHTFDLEGHGLSPTSPLSKLTIDSFAADVNGVFEKANISSGATLVAHSLGSLIAVNFALQYPEKVSKLILLGPPPSPLPEAGVNATYARAKVVRTKGMAGVVDAVATAGTSEKSKTSVAIAAVRMSLLSQDPEGYAKACTALASANALDFAAIRARTLIVTGSEDKTSPPQLCEKYVEQMKGNAKLNTLPDVGHWHVFEDTPGVAKAVQSFLA
ncbi:fumarylacetoacetate hydrolase-like protein [Paraphoma chrysanthemicola]|uniref:Fumarylacetoacetate hydrolase-like protein n=1 Tax=Paraphoma chrysanthemicola TaxID=798071 RepID=A0A8K0REM2_9PLEO|nr:fumarylacetoacetate hydrolase-like protein [Paraphoma chrysanthemicola]